MRTGLARMGRVRYGQERGYDMKKLIFALALVVGVCWICSDASAASTRGYVKKNGTYVQPYQRTAPDRSKYNNYSTKGNVNPYTGKKGSVDPYKTNTPRRGR